ncbi:hypothetical protein D3C87_1900440 [compost metagenome]
MQCIEIGANDIGIEQRRYAVAQENRHFSERIAIENLGVGVCRAGFVMLDNQLMSNPHFMREDQRLAGKGRMSLIKKLH